VNGDRISVANPLRRTILPSTRAIASGIGGCLKVPIASLLCCGELRRVTETPAGDAI